MAYKYNFVRVTALGKLGTTDEIFSFGWHHSKLDGNITEAQWNGLGPEIGNMQGGPRVFFTEIFNGIPNQWKLTSVKVALIGTNGKYEPFAAPYEWIYETPHAGADTNSTAPQLSAVVSLVSDKPRDPGRYNRFYVPARGSSDNNYFMNAQVQNSLANSAVDMILTANDGLSTVIPGIVPAVVSASGSGHVNPIVTTRVGNVIDTQRRRRNKLQESYVSAELI